MVKKITKIQQVRKKHAITQKRLARITGYSREHVARIESNRFGTPAPMLKLLDMQIVVNALREHLRKLKKVDGELRAEKERSALVTAIKRIDNVLQTDYTSVKT